MIGAGKLERYVMGRTLAGVGAALAVISAVIILVSFVNLSREVAVRADVGVAQLFGLTHDQFFRFEKGKGQVVIDGKTHKIKADYGVIVPAGARHNVINTGDKPLKLYTLYGPPEHRDGVVRATKAEAEASEEHFDGVLTEDGPGTRI